MESTTTLVSLALEYNNTRGPAGKTFQEVYKNAIDSSYSAVMAQPNVAVANFNRRDNGSRWKSVVLLHGWCFFR